MTVKVPGLIEQLVAWLVGWLLDAFINKGRQEVAAELEKKHAETQSEWDRIDRQPVDGRAALERLQSDRYAQGADGANRRTDRDS